jgi:hypothetical protein
VCGENNRRGVGGVLRLPEVPQNLGLHSVRMG